MTHPDRTDALFPIEPEDPDIVLGRAIYRKALEHRRGFRPDQIGIDELDNIWLEIFKEIGVTAKSEIAIPAAVEGKRIKEHENDRYITTEDKQVYDRLRDSFLSDDEIEKINPYEKMPQISDNIILNIFTVDEHPIYHDMKGQGMGHKYYISYAERNAIRKILRAHASQNAEIIRQEIQNALDCFNAAYIEGLADKLAEEENTDTGSLHDLVTRRILYAINHLDAALAEIKKLS